MLVKNKIIRGKGKVIYSKHVIRVKSKIEHVISIYRLDA